MKGKLIIFSAPSGAGKTTIVHHLLEHDPRLEFSVSACSREKRKNESDGKDYYFLGIDKFKEKITNDEFLEWEEVYPDQFYGTLKSEIERIHEKGNHVIFDVDVVGGLNIKKHYGKAALAVFVMPPSIEDLEKRLIFRSTETPDKIRRRIEKAEKELITADQFDRTLLNDDLERACSKAEGIVNEFLMK